MELFSYFRSSAAYRVRIALNLKGLDHKITGVNLLEKAHKSTDYLAINPQGLVPSLKTTEGNIVTQSPAILEWLEENYSEVPLLPSNSLERAKIRSWCYQVACDIHPICNLRVMNYVSNDLNGGEEGKLQWIRHWISEGFSALEQQLTAAPYCNGDKVSLADVYLIPQVFNALRFNVDMTHFPRILSIYNACNQLPAFINAHPDKQKDAS